MHPRSILIALCLLLATGLPLQAAAPLRLAAAPVPWRLYHQGLEQARSQKKHAFVQFYATWCGYCRKMDQTGFGDRRVRQALARFFIPVRVTEKSQTQIAYQGNVMSEHALISEYGITGYPTLMFLDPDGKLISKQSGYLEPEEMLSRMLYIGTSAYKKMDYTSFRGKVLPKYLKS